MEISSKPAAQKVLEEVLAERVRQDAKWGPQNHTPVAYFAILAEEHGEVAKEVVEATFARSAPERRERLAKMRVELVQEAAVAVAMVEALDRQMAGEAPVLCPCKTEL